MAWLDWVKDLDPVYLYAAGGGLLFFITLLVFLLRRGSQPGEAELPVD